MNQPLRFRLLIFVAVAVGLPLSVFLAATAHAATLHHWRFEDSPGFLQDSVGDAHLAASPAASQYALPNSGPGEHFPDSFQLFGANESAAEFSGAGSNGLTAANSTPVTGDFTVEMFYHANPLTGGSFGDTLASQAASVNAAVNAPSQISWSFQVRFDGFGGTQPNELTLFLSDGAVFHTPRSGIIITPLIDYYLAASFDFAGGEVTYHVQDLTSGTPLQTVSASHSLSALQGSPTILIGDVIGLFPLHGVIDEVRFSNHVLSIEELLVNDPIPEPSALVLAAAGLAAGLMGRRVR